jgi:hypothetical protein
VSKPRSISFTRQLAVNSDYDVIVVGGGPSGCTAAAAAAREGARTLLIEATGSLGGMGTSALVPAWCPFSDKQQIIYKGLAEKVFTEAKRDMAHVAPDAMDWVPIDPERLKRVYDDLVISHGASILFHTMLAGVNVNNGTVTSIVVNNKSGLTAYSAKVYIDTTGDADLAAWAGAPFLKGDGPDPAHPSGLQPATHCFTLSNVDDYAYRTSPWLHQNNPKSAIYDILKSGKFPEIPDFHICNNIVGPGTVGFNAGHLYNVDSTNPLSMSEALVRGRKMADTFRRALAEYHPAFRNAFLVMTGSLLGIRESRRIVGDYTLTLEDYIARRAFPDEICRNSYFIDVHNKIKEAGASYAHALKLDESFMRYRPGESHGVPYRCLTPQSLNNVLVAGRSVSCDQLVQGSVRVMPVCLAMGEAAGIAAALAADGSASTREIDVNFLRTRLRQEGAYLPEPEPAALAPQPAAVGGHL